jgi:rRNA maturation RNase YbeY
MKVAVIDRQKGLRIDQDRLKHLVRYFMQRVTRAESLTAWEAISVILADDATIQSINAGFLHHDYVTDVIAFTYAPVPGAEAGATGELVVNVERARRIGHRFGGPERELALYVAHGCDHLGGADDATPVERRRMRARECRWLRAPAVRDRLSGLICQEAAQTRT